MMQSQIAHVHTFAAPMMSPAGTYTVRVLGRQRSDGTWEGWLEFSPFSGLGAVLSTGQETTQPDLKALEYWAGGLEPIYFTGALERAQRRSAG